MTELNLFEETAQDKAEFEAMQNEAEPVEVAEEPPAEEPAKEAVSEGSEPVEKQETSETTEETTTEEPPAEEIEQTEQTSRRQTAQERVRQSRQQVREARDELAAERQLNRDFQEKMQSRLDTLTARPEPDAEYDPEAYAAHQKEIADQAVKERDELVQQNEEKQTADTRSTQIQEWLTDTIDDYVEDHPDYVAAQKFVFDDEVRLLMEERGATREGAEESVTKELGLLATSYYEKGYNPCQFLYSQAQKRGFKPEASQTEEEPVKQEETNGNL
ncbi:unnamed protein product, partial [marine sediment metagenome]